MTTAPNIEDLRAQARAVMVTRRPDLSFDEGDVSEMFADEMAAMADLDVGVGARQVAATYLDGASGDELTELVSDHFQIDREEATQAAGTITFTRPSTGSGGTIPAGARVATAVAADGSFREYTTDIDLTFLPAQLSLSVAATAVTSGVEGNAAASTITRILDTVFDTTFTVSNAERFAGGNAEEDDDSLRARARNVNASRARGTLAALETGARQVETVAVATAVEVGSGVVTVYVADQDGNSNTAMETAVDAELVNWKAGGACVQAVGGVQFIQAIDISLVLRTGASVTELATPIREAIISALGRLSAGDTLYQSLIRQAARNVDRDAILEVTVNTPAATIVPEANEIIRTNTANVSIS